MMTEGFRKKSELRPIILGLTALKHDRGEALMRALQFGVDNLHINGLQHIEAVDKGPDEAVLMQGYILGLTVLCEDAIYWCETFGDNEPAEIDYTETLNALNQNKAELERLNGEMLAWVFHKAGLFDFEDEENIAALDPNGRIEQEGEK